MSSLAQRYDTEQCLISSFQILNKITTYRLRRFQTHTESLSVIKIRCSDRKRSRFTIHRLLSLESGPFPTYRAPASISLKTLTWFVLHAIIFNLWHTFDTYNTTSYMPLNLKCYSAFVTMRYSSVSVATLILSNLYKTNMTLWFQHLCFSKMSCERGGP